MAKRISKTGMIKKLDQSPEAALFSGQLEGLVALCYENERPLQGLSGLLDWRFRGAFSQYLKQGAFCGEIGEVVYLPVRSVDRTFHILLVGGGEATRAGVRQGAPEKSIAALTQNLRSLNLSRMGLSMVDFGEDKEEFYSRKMGGIPLWLTQ